MTVSTADIVFISLPDKVLYQCMSTAGHIAAHITDRTDLHERDSLERYINILMGEVAEQMVIHWLQANQKFAASAVDKNATVPDAGHDVWIRTQKGDRKKASVKSSLSALKQPKDILTNFTLAVTPSERRDVNIQVYFWLNVSARPRVSVPALRQSAIFAWATAEDLAEQPFQKYKGEDRLAPQRKLGELRSMASLLDWLI